MKPDDSLSDSPELQRAIQLISALFDERLTVLEQAELEELLLRDSSICGLYVNLAHLHAGLYKYASALGSVGDREPSIGSEESGELGDALLNETMVMPALNIAVVDSDFTHLDQEEFTPAPYSPQPPAESRYNWYLPAGIAALLATILGTALYVMVLSRHPVNPGIVAQTPLPIPEPVIVETPPPVATLALSSKPVWQSNYSPPGNGKFEAGRSLMLTSGVVQLELHMGGRLVIEGPANLQFLNDSRLVLNQGKLVALVPGGGLVIQCPNGTVKDLGTEFGLEVRPNGATEVAVFQGSVAAALASAASTQSTRETVVSVGQAAVISDKKIDRSKEGAIQQRYICSLRNDGLTTLDVTDLVCGGDGTTQRRGIAIDSTNGDIGDLFPVGNRNGDGRYHRIVGYPVLDGTFIPDGSVDQMQVDSAGDVFKFTTACNTTHNLIETGGPIRWNDTPGVSTKLAGVDYSKPGHSIICTHCNNGLTLDLAAIRHLYPDRELTRFQCRMGNSYTNGYFRAQKVDPIAGAFVLINGKARFSKPRFSNQDGSFLVDLPLYPADRFLTLAATDANTDIDQQWILWTDAKLRMTTK